MAQLSSLEVLAGVKEKLSIEQMLETASLIRGKYGHLKVSELMLFFTKLKTGEYGKFYGVVDPMVIMEALPRFMDERNRAWDKREQEENYRRIAEQKKDAITYEEYKARHAKDSA